MAKNFHEPGLGPEHPFGDFIQFLMFIIFLVVWVLDSIFFEFFKLNALIPLFIRVAFSILLLVLSGYLVVKSHFMVFGENRIDKFVETSVYSIVRHPMYLGGLLFFLGLVIITLSVLSFIIWCGMFIIYDWLASYEENELVRIVGRKYEKYQEKVSKWIPYIL